MILKLSLISLFTLSFSLHAKTALSKIVKIAGSVYSGTHLLRLNDRLTEGALIEAKGEKSFAIISLPDGPHIMINNGKIKIKKVRPENTLIKIFNGKLFTNKREKNSLMEVETGQITLNVRDASFFVQEQKEKSYLSVCSGKVAAKNDVNEIVVEKGEDAHGVVGKRMSKNPANLQVWNLVKDGFKKMEIDIGSRPEFNKGPKKFKF